MATDRRAEERLEFEETSLAALRDEVTRVMLVLDEIGLHEAAGHVCMSLHVIDEAARSPVVPVRTWFH